jgi:hypothetical protein
VRPGMARLLEVLRGRDECHAMDDVEWDAMLSLAEEEHVAAWVVACLRDRSASMARRRQSDLERIERASTIAAFYWSCQLKELLSAFARQTIAVVPLKGPLLAEKLYGTARLRSCRDLDLLVGRGDLKRAEPVLETCGFMPGEPDDYHRAWSRRGAVVELHYDVENPLAFNFAVEGALRRVSAASFQGEVCMQFAPEDELLYLCLHAARHRYERLSLVVDLRLGFEKLTRCTRQWAPRDEVRDLDGLMGLGLAMVRRLDPGFEVDLEIGVSAKYHAHLEEVAERLWRRLTTQTCVPLDWRAVHALFMEVEEPGWSRVRRWGRHVRILSGRVIEADSLFAARFGLHAGWHARLLRPVRLVSEAIGARRSDG